jgi:hypothetical protein
VSKSFLIAAAAIVLIWLFLRGQTATASQATSKIASYAPTQLGAPASAIARLTYAQLVSDVTFWVDPVTGLLITNTPGLLNGAVPLVALSDETQIKLWAQKNPTALADMGGLAASNF